MALTVEEVICMLEDTYDDNSNADLEFDVMEQENKNFQEKVS